MKNIAVITSKDEIWSLPVWNNTIPKLIEDYNLKGFWVTEKTKIGGTILSELFWYLKNFGLFNTIKLGLFMCLVLLKRKCFRHNGNLSFSNLCKINQISYHCCNSPNDKKFIDWVIKNNIDIIIIMVDQILKQPIINAPNIGILNKHAALLPSNKGILPYIWAYLKGNKQGVSFHKVEKTIDTGEIYFQNKISSRYTNSLIQFYIHVFNNYTWMLQKAIKNMVDDVVMEPNKDYEPSYHSLPCKETIRTFEKKNGCIIRIKDLLLAFKL